MSNLPSVIELGAVEEAERLWLGSLEAREAADDDFPALCEALELGLRAVEILATFRLRRVREDFPPSVRGRLEAPHPEVNPLRDATAPQEGLDFVVVLDLLSAGDLACVAPGMHKGWARRSACLRSRQAAQGALSLILGEEERAPLLVLAAYRNRVFRSPPPLRVVPMQILNALGSLDRLKDALG